MALLWIIEPYFGQKGLFEDKVSLHKMLIDGLETCWLLVDYYDVFISFLDSHSEGTYSLQRIHWWARHVMLKYLQICSDEEISSPTSSIDSGWVHFLQIFIFGWTIPLTVSLQERGVGQMGHPDKSEDKEHSKGIFISNENAGENAMHITWQIKIGAEHTCWKKLDSRGTV